MLHESKDLTYFILSKCILKAISKKVVIYKLNQSFEGKDHGLLRTYNKETFTQFGYREIVIIRINAYINTYIEVLVAL